MIRLEGFTGRQLWATRRRLTATARRKVARKPKWLVKVLLFILLFSGVGLLASQAALPDQATAGASRTKIDVCALLTSAEVEAVQGEPIKETNPSEQHGSFLMSQCFLGTTTFVKSVSLALAVPDPSKPSALTPREYWKKQFHPPDQVEKEKQEPTEGKANSSKETKEERDKELSRPHVIDGLGEEAYWVGNPITGALYVLKGEVFLRISVGGVRDESDRIEKSKVLARAALGRF